MPSKPATWLFALVGLVVAISAAVVVTRQTARLLRREPGAADDLATRPWVEQPIGRSGVVLEAPWHLEGVSVPFPREMAGKVSQWTWIGHEADGIRVMASRVTFAYGISPSLEGAADGMVKNVREVPGTASVTPQRSATTLLGRPAIELEIHIEREKGESLVMHGIVAVRGLDLFQVLAMARADQPVGGKVWERMRDSIRSATPARLAR